MVQLIANAAFIANSNACLFITGKTPGIPMQTGQVEELGASPNLVLQPQNSLVLVISCT